MMNNETLNEIKAFLIENNDAETRKLYAVIPTWAEFDESVKDWGELGANVHWARNFVEACETRRQIEIESDGEITAHFIEFDD